MARALREIAILLRLDREPKFRARAYERAAYALEHGSADLGALIASRQLTSIAGIGTRLAAVIEEIHRTGTAVLLERLRSKFPDGTVELIDVPHLGLKKIAALAAHGITTRAALREACETGRIRDVPGFGPALQRQLLEALTTPSGDEHFILASALGAAHLLIEYLEGDCSVQRAEVVGGVRRCQETVEQIDLVAASGNANHVLDHFLAYPGSVATLSRGVAEASLRLLSGPIAVLHVAAPRAFVSARHYHTGSAAHLNKLQERAREMNLRLDPGALWAAGERRLAVTSEEEIYRHLGLPFIPAELREDSGEVEAALDGRLPSDLIQLCDVRGMTHVHTVYSDGRNTIEEMARAAEEMGMKYLTITDHSPSAAYAGGVTLERLEQQWEEIARVQERVSIRLLRGTEADILRDGALDYADSFLERFDVIIASIHARHRLPPEEMTSRIVRAMEYPVFKIWGHPLGRLLNIRPPIECEVERILDAIAAADAAIEVNGDPHRLDLEPHWIRRARARGIRFVLSTDAHSVRGLSNLRFAVSMARRGWVSRSDVLNALPTADFIAAVRPCRGSNRPSATAANA